jgi:hypothetical protein
MLAKVEADALIDEINHEHQEELRAVAWKKGTEDGVDWTTEELSAVELVAVDEEGIHIEEVLCSSTDQRCIAVDLPIPWPQGMQLSQLAEMRAAFNDLVRKAYSSVGIEDIPPEYQMQQQELDSLMSLMNAEFGRLLKFYALSQASEALSPTEEVEKARLTQLTFEGLTLELTTIELGPEPAFGGRLERKVWSTSVLFEEPCNCPDEVEEELIQMFSEERAPDRSQDFVDVGQH